MIYIFTTLWLLCGAIGGFIGSQDLKKTDTYKPTDLIFFLTIGLMCGPFHLLIALMNHYI